MLVCHSVSAVQKMLDICSYQADFSLKTVTSVAPEGCPRWFSTLQSTCVFVDFSDCAKCLKSSFVIVF